MQDSDALSTTSPATTALAAVAAGIKVELAPDWPEWSQREFDEGRWVGEFCSPPILCSFPIRLGSSTLHLTPMFLRNNEDYYVLGAVSAEGEWYELTDGDQSRIATALQTLDPGLALWNANLTPTELAGFTAGSVLTGLFAVECSRLLGEAILDTHGLTKVRDNLPALVAEMQQIWEWCCRALTDTIDD